MKSKKIPVDIKEKSIKQAQNEIDEILLKLEDSETNLENSKEQYERMVQLNNHIQQQFREQANSIKHFKLGKKIYTKNLK